MNDPSGPGRRRLGSSKPEAPIRRQNYDGYTIVPGIDIVELPVMRSVLLSAGGGRAVMLTTYELRDLASALHQLYWAMEKQPKS
jgi:hypothetical protein